MIIDMGDWTWTERLDKGAREELRDWLRGDGSDPWVQDRMADEILRRHRRRGTALGKASPNAGEEQIAIDLLEAHLKATW